MKVKTTRQEVQRISNRLGRVLWAREDEEEGVVKEDRFLCYRIRNARCTLGLSVEEFARMFGVAPGTIASWERRESAKPQGSSYLLLQVLEVVLEGKQPTEPSAKFLRFLEAWWVIFNKDAKGVEWGLGDEEKEEVEEEEGRDEP